MYCNNTKRFITYVFHKRTQSQSHKQNLFDNYYIQFDF